MEIRYTVTKESAIASFIHQQDYFIKEARKDFLHGLVFILTTIAFAALFICATWVYHTLPNEYKILVFAMGGLLFIIITLGYATNHIEGKAIRETFFRDADKLFPNHITVYPNERGIKIIGNHGESLIGWPQIFSVSQEENNVVVKFGLCDALPIPNHAFKDRNELSSFTALVMEGIRSQQLTQSTTARQASPASDQPEFQRHAFSLLGKYVFNKTLLIVVLAVSACIAYKTKVDKHYENVMKSNYLSKASLSIACPDDSEFAIWPDKYSGQPSKATGIGCIDKAGSINGWHIAWQSKNAKEHEGTQINGVSQGEWTYFHENGKLSARGHYVNNRREGEWLYYHKNGNLHSSGYYVNNNLEGIWQYWNEKGNSLGPRAYSEGKTIRLTPP